ncbi:EAL domain-containing protein [Actinoplanes sp. NPDC023714]|uniref:EAL domain-containing protein n=1 Tax=Actinoplanes sp. NPDC023714 TaxID=3154322 RepID=UPI0033CE8431
MPRTHDTGTAAVTIDAVLAGRLVRPLFQPIVELSTRTVVGLEGLARGPAGSDLEFPDRLFAAAGAAGVLGELDMLCFERALEGAMAAPVAPPLLFANGEPAVMDQPLSPRLLELLASGPSFRTILEYTERALPAVPGSLLRLAGQIQLFGNAVALDDVGVDPMSLAFLPVLEPEVIKLDMSLIRDPHAAHTRTVAAVVHAEAQRTGALVIAEGIETEDDLVTARDLGAHWGQGWLFGRPGPLDTVRHPYNPEAAAALRRPRPGFHQPAGTPFEIAAARAPRREATREAVVAELARVRDIAARDDATVVVASCSETIAARLGVPLYELAGRARSTIILDRPVDGELAVAIIGAGHGYAATLAGADLVTTGDLPTVAAVARVLLNRHTRG